MPARQAHHRLPRANGAAVGVNESVAGLPLAALQDVALVAGATAPVLPPEEGFTLFEDYSKN